jgi:cytochrome c
MEHSMRTAIPLLIAGAVLAFATWSSDAAAVDAKQAEALMKSNKCGSCHHPTRTKSGPSLAKIAEKYRGEVDGEEKVIAAMTSGPMVENEDGEQEEHKIIKVKNEAALKNLAQWILAHGE